MRSPRVLGQTLLFSSLTGYPLDFWFRRKLYVSTKATKWEHVLGDYASPMNRIILEEPSRFAVLIVNDTMVQNFPKRDPSGKWDHC